MHWRAGVVFGLLSVTPLIADETKQQAVVSIVEVPLFVHDKQGNPVIDLRQDEVVVSEDGKQQKIELFVPVDLKKRSELTIAPEVSRRNFILFFDSTFNTPAGLLRAKQAARRWVENQLPEGDQASVYAFSSLKGVFMVSNFTSDRRLLCTALDSLGIDRKFDSVLDSAGFANLVLMTPEIRTLIQADITARGYRAEHEAPKDLYEKWIRELNARTKRDSEDYYRNTVSQYLEGIRSFARSLEFFPGRKFLIYFSGGFDTRVLGEAKLTDLVHEAEMFWTGDYERIAAEGSAETRDMGRNLSDMMTQALKYFATSDCRVFPVNSLGLVNDANTDYIDTPAADAEAPARKQASLFSFAEETGGKLYKNSNDLDGPLSDILMTTESYYLLAYNPPPRSSKKTGVFHEIKVEIKRPGVEYGYRKGYHDPLAFSELTPDERRLQVAEAINDPHTWQGVIFQAEALAFPEENGRSPVGIVVQMQGEQFERAKKDLLLEIYSFAIGPGNQFESYSHGFCKVPAGVVAGKLQENGVRYSDLLLLEPGLDYDVRVLVRNNESGDVGTTALKVTTRKAEKGFAMATPFFVLQQSDWLNVIGYDPAKPPARVAAAGGEFPISYRGKPCSPEIYPDLQDGRSRALLIKLYNFTPDPATNEADVRISWEILDQAGKSIEIPTYQLLEKPHRVSPTRLDYVFSIKAIKLPKGYLWLKVKATDNLSKQSASDWVPLLVN